MKAELRQTLPNRLTTPLSESLTVQPGTVLAGKYRVERVLGEGGMGIVVAAHHLQLDEKVALKFLLPHALQNPEAVSRFLREARAAVKIKSEHVARVIDVGELENGAPYMVMEYLNGTDLSGWLRQQGAFPIEQAVSFVLQACEALAEAHSLGIVHRDLKPANLFCIQRPDGELSIKVLDFGISKLTAPGSSAHDMTRTSAVMGTPYYMSPEQMLASKDVDVRSDIWALGIILFELVTGSPPFTAEAITELAIKVSREPAPPLRAFIANPPAKLDEAIQKCLEKDRSNRYSNVGDLVVALKDLGGKGARQSAERVLGTFRKAGLATTALPDSAPKGDAPPPVAPTVASTAASWGQTAPGGRAGKAKIWATLGALLVASAGGGVFLATRPEKAPERVAPAEPNPLPVVLVKPDPVDVVVPLPPVVDAGGIATGSPVIDAGHVGVNAGGAHAGVTGAHPGTSVGSAVKPVDASTPTLAATTAPSAPTPPRVPVCTVVAKLDGNGQEHFVQECK